MRATFLHMADCHLGYRQYNSRDRQSDFARAYFDIIDRAIKQKVDFVLLAGDLFEKRAIDPRTLVHAITGLERLRVAGIPCLAVEGNHELAYHRDRMGWMEFLAERELLTLLNPKIEGERVTLSPYAQRRGAYVEPLPGLRVYGMRYCGSATAHVVHSVAGALAASDRRGVEYTILMAHTGVEGVVAGRGDGLNQREMAPLRPHVDYLALGHFHNPFEFDNWIYNPGSAETNSMTEAAWPERGSYLVEVDTETRPKHRAVLHANARRPFQRLFFKVDGCDTPVKLVDHCRRYVERGRRQFKGNAPVVELRLTGVLPFDRSALPLEPIKQMVEEVYRPLICFVRNDTRAAEFAVEEGQQLSRPALERQIIAGLLERDSRFRARGAEWTELALAIKDLAVSGASAEAVLDEFAQGEERIRKGRADLSQGDEFQC